MYLRCEQQCQHPDLLQSKARDVEIPTSNVALWSQQLGSGRIAMGRDDLLFDAFHVRRSQRFRLKGCGSKHTTYHESFYTQ